MKAREFRNGWEVRHETIGEAYNQFKCESCIEIGVAWGQLARYLITNVKTIKQYHGVDPFLGGYDETDTTSNQIRARNSSLLWGRAILHELSEFNCTFKLHQGHSVDRAKDFSDRSIDCIFIDGDHTYAGAKADIQYYAPKLRRGGVLFFDDYHPKHYPGVVKAVDEYVAGAALSLKKINFHNNYYVVGS